MEVKQRATLDATQADPPVDCVVLRAVNRRQDQRYYLYQPPKSDPALPLFVTVHGISINARDQARLFAPWAKKIGATIISPIFDPHFYPDYQRLGRTGHGKRADIALDAMLTSAAADSGCSNHSLALFGFSGGAQFAHRYTMANPERIAAQVLVAPGWFTFPDGRRYPYGTRKPKRLPGIEFDSQKYLSVDSLVLVGADDTMRDASLRSSDQLDRRQGFNRVERGQRWIAAMQKACAATNRFSRYKFETLDGCGHDFEQCMRLGSLGQKTMSFLYQDS